MNIAMPRLAATALALGAAAAAAAGAAAAANPPAFHPVLLMAALWLVLLGWGFRAALGRHLRFNDRLASSETELGAERHARQLAERALADTHTRLCRLVHQQEHVREQERKRIARDIHDDLGQHLLALKIELSLMQANTGGADPLHPQIGSLLHKLELTIASLRAIIHGLRPLALEQGLQSAMETHLSEFSRVNGIHYQLDAGPGAFHPSRDHAVDAMLFRILQEALANVVRHAQATEVTIALHRSGDQLTMTVRDNGIGMAALPASRGCGLAGIAERVSAAGGQFAIDSEPGAGTLLSLSVPLPQRASTH
jgi:signal transduction histidine kinase